MILREVTAPSWLLLIWILTCMLAGCEPGSPDARLKATPLRVDKVQVSQTFDYIVGIAALDDSLSLLADGDARALYLTNWKTHSTSPTGHQGSGPGEYQSLGAPLPGGPGRILILDRRQRRVLGFDSTGWFNVGDLRTLPLGVALHGGDRNGNLYFEYRPISHEGGGTSYADSSLILRLMPGGTVDTIARLLAPKQVIHVIRSKNANGDVSSNSMAFEAPYSPRDVWAVNPDRGVTVLRSNPVRLDRITDDSVLRGFTIDLPLIQIQEGDKSDSLIPVPKEELPPWPEVLPPFVGTARLCGAEQRLIVRRPGHVGDSTETWLQLSPENAEPAAFSIPSAERVVGCDRAWLYTARLDSTEVEALVRYRMP